MIRTLEMQFQPATNPVSDFVGFSQRGELELNPDFQRNAVWGPDARSYLIDSILLGYPVPPIFLRTRIDVVTQRTLREVVDGQQRLSAILDFAKDEFALNSRSSDFRGLKYSDLSTEFQQDYLMYPITSYIIKDENDRQVLEVFARLNSFTVKLNRAELRHAMYQTPLRWFIVDLAREFRSYFLDRKIITRATAVRMGDESFCSELINLLINGLVDGGEAALDRLYRQHREELTEKDSYRHYISDWINWLESGPISAISGTRLNSQHQMLMIFAAYSAINGRLPVQVEGIDTKVETADTNIVSDRFRELALALELGDDASARFTQFVKGSSGQTTRMASRLPRFEAFLVAISAQNG